MSSILLDTHVLVWLLLGNKKIGKKAASLISKALQEDNLYFSAITIWEIAMLAERGRIKLAQPIHHWYKNILSFGIKEISFYGDVAIDSVLLSGFHADPSDRMIVATAIDKDLTLITADCNILEWSGLLKRIDASK